MSKKVSSGHLSEAIEDALQLLPNMKISNLTHILTHGSSEYAEKTKQELMDLIIENSMYFS